VVAITNAVAVESLSVAVDTSPTLERETNR